MPPKISVITPASRGVKELSSLLNDFKNQTFRDFEHIIVYDGTPPDEVTALMKKAGPWTRFVSIEKDLGDMKQSPGTNPRNHGIKIALGDYLVFADDDDRYKGTYLEVLMSHTVNNAITIVQVTCQQSRIYKNGKPETTILIPEIDLPYFPICCHVASPSSIVKREWALAEPWRHEPNHDYEFIKRICNRFKPEINIIGGMQVDIDGAVIKDLKDWVTIPPFYRGPDWNPPMTQTQIIIQEKKETKMNFTGERYVPDTNLPIICCEHWHRYFFATEFIKGKKIIDISSGEGYGSSHLANFAASVTGVDISKEAVEHASKKYIKPNLKYIQGSATSIPLSESGTFDVITSFETIEHINEIEQEKFLREVTRLLKPEGIFIVSTPNKLLYTDIPNHKNEYHKKEFYIEEFEKFIKKHFKFMKFLGQKIYNVSYIWNTDDINTFSDYAIGLKEGSAVPVDEPKQVIYSVVVASNKELKKIGSSILRDQHEMINSMRQDRMNSLYNENLYLKKQIQQLAGR